MISSGSTSISCAVTAAASERAVRMDTIFTPVSLRAGNGSDLRATGVFRELILQDVILPFDEFGVPVAKRHLPAVGPVVIDGVRVVLSPVGLRLVGIQDQPDINRAGDRAF